MEELQLQLVALFQISEKLQLRPLSTGFMRFFVKTGSQPVRNWFCVALTYTFKMYLKILKTLKI